MITACAAFRNPDSIPSKYFLAPSPSTLACSPSPRCGAIADRNDSSRQPPPCIPIHRASDVATASRPTPPRRRSPARALAGNDDPAHRFAAIASRRATPAAPRPGHPRTLTVHARLFHVSSGNTQALQRSPRQPGNTRHFPWQSPLRTAPLSSSVHLDAPGYHPVRSNGLRGDRCALHVAELDLPADRANRGERLGPARQASGVSGRRKARRMRPQVGRLPTQQRSGREGTAWAREDNDAKRNERRRADADGRQDRRAANAARRRGQVRRCASRCGLTSACSSAMWSSRVLSAGI